MTQETLPPFDPTVDDVDAESANMTEDQIYDLIRFLSDEVLHLRQEKDMAFGGVAS